ncbi:AraC family transcriptional regulator [Nocardia sp. CNY236]|uniref:helix-turn-helix transcriptional regulator n=1 Tax=Nocardia sp. CNY236 TaxID=1169152 RepID=UPI001E617F8F|nr:AraC family transcriptional regulator [Nocardia sp. CNY236]
MSASISEPARLVRHRDGIPVFDYRTDPAVPPVSVLRAEGLMRLRHTRPHIHQFPILMYVSGSGAAYAVAAGHVIDPARSLECSPVAAVAFDPTSLAGDKHALWPMWRAHPLLVPFRHRHPDGLLPLRVPAARHGIWEAAIAAIEHELAVRQTAQQHAVLAHLTVLLVDLARMTSDIAVDPHDDGDQLLAAVFDEIDRRYTEPLSLRDIAEAVSLTPGYLTTLVGRRTGRTVQEWITQRRMAAARYLLINTDLPVDRVACRVGISDPTYFIRLFRRHHDIPPRRWRNHHTIRDDQRRLALSTTR